MATPRIPLLALAIALVAVSLVGPGIAAAGDHDVDDTTTLTTTLSTPTLTATPTVDTPVNKTEVVGPLENTTDDVADSTNDSIDDAGGTVDDTIEVIGGDTLLDSTLTADTVLSTDGAVDATETDSPTPTPEPESPTATAAADGGSPTETTATVGADGLPIDTPADPLLGGAVLGGVAALGGLAGRELLLSRGPFRTASAATLDAVARWWDRLGLPLGLFGYQRYDDSSPLDHEGRRQLAEAVRADPGVHLSALSDATELPLSTARYHLRILEHEGLVRAVKLHGKRRYFPPDVEGEALVASLTDEATANVLRSLVDAGPASVSELAERIDRDPSTVSHHLDRLANEGLVERERAGRAVVSSATPEVEAALDRLRSDDGVAVARPAATD